MKLSVFSVSLCLSTTLTAANHLESRESCPADYTICAPSGAKTAQVPEIGDSTMQSLFVDLIGSSLPDGKKAVLHSVRDGQTSASLCCVSSLTCLIMSHLLIPFCYDRYTTGYFLPDGSYGTVVRGTFENPVGDVANLLSGDYTLKSGMKGNIYADNESAKPNTATLSLPSQFTGEGIGSAIPPSALGAVLTVIYTTVLPGTTVFPSTIVATTRSAHMIGGSTQPATTWTSTLAGSTLVSVEIVTTETTIVASSGTVSTISETTLSTILGDSTAFGVIQATLIPLSTVPAATIEASTIPGTTIELVTTTRTTTIPAGQSTTTISSDFRAATTEVVSTTRGRASSLDPLLANMAVMCILVMWFVL